VRNFNLGNSIHDLIITLILCKYCIVLGEANASFSGYYKWQFFAVSKKMTLMAVPCACDCVRPVAYFKKVVAKVKTLLKYAACRVLWGWGLDSPGYPIVKERAEIT
jgi:bacteriorhodopsin